MVSGGKLISRPRRIAGRLLGVALEGEGLFDEGVEIATRQRDKPFVIFLEDAEANGLQHCRQREGNNRRGVCTGTPWRSLPMR